MKTLQETVNYIHKYITEYDQGQEEIDKDALYEMMEEGLFDIAESILTEEEMTKLVASEDKTYIDQVLSQKLNNYPALLESIKNDILNNYVLEEGEEKNPEA